MLGRYRLLKLWEDRETRARNIKMVERAPRHEWLAEEGRYMYRGQRFARIGVIRLHHDELG